MGDVNKFYYDENLKKWVEEGVDFVFESVLLLFLFIVFRFMGISFF